MIYLLILIDIFRRYIRCMSKSKVTWFFRNYNIVLPNHIIAFIKTFQIHELTYFNTRHKIFFIDFDVAKDTYKNFLISTNLVYFIKDSGLLDIYIDPIHSITKNKKVQNSLYFSILLHRFLIEKLFPMDRIGIFCTTDGHYSVFIEVTANDSIKDFLILDSGYLSYCPIFASELFPLIKHNKEITPDFGFNLVNIWDYESKTDYSTEMKWQLNKII